jgi:hypothetical protein
MEIPGFLVDRRCSTFATETKKLPSGADSLRRTIKAARLMAWAVYVMVLAEA